MKKSLTINATRAGKKVAKNIGFVNPNVANSLVGSAAQMFNALTNDTFVNSEVVKVMDTNEEEQQSGGGLLNPNLRIENGLVTWEGDGVCTIQKVQQVDANTFALIELPQNKNYTAPPYDRNKYILVLTSDGTYAKDWY